MSRRVVFAELLDGPPAPVRARWLATGTKLSHWGANNSGGQIVNKKGARTSVQDVVCLALFVQLDWAQLAVLVG